MSSDVSEPSPRPVVSLRQVAYDSIRQRVLDGSYAPGSLLSENQIGDELGISRTPVREALRDLVGAGLVRILPQRGIIVSDLTAADIIEVYQVREELECLAVALATPRLTARKKARLQTDHRRAVAALGAGRLRQAYDHAVLMHARIIEAAGNARLSRFMDQLADEAHRYGLITLRAGHAEHAIRDHGTIIAALVQGDGARAAALMRQHLRADRDLALRSALPCDAAPAPRAAARRGA